MEAKNYNIVVWNVRGLNNLSRRAAVTSGDGASSPGP
jgi:hypothetical protein